MVVSVLLLLLTGWATVAESVVQSATTANIHNNQGQRGFVIEERPCHLLQQTGSATLRCKNVTVAYVNENYLKNDRVLSGGGGGGQGLRELLLEYTISSSPKQYLAMLRHEEQVEIFKFVNSNVTNDHLESLLANNLRYPNLRAFDLTGNRLSRVVFKNPMDRLKILRLSDNEIENLPMESFDHVKNLNELYLDGNRLTSITGIAEGHHGEPGQLFSQLQHLYVLDLSRNRLNDLPRNVFTGLGKLKTLNLSRNRLSTSYSMPSPE